MLCIRAFALLSIVSLAALTSPLGCEKKPEPTKPAAGSSGSTKTVGHALKDDEDHDHADEHDHGATTQLGEQIVGVFTIKASREGAVTPGKDAPIDAWVTGATAKVDAVRFWIGTQDGKGSVKARAEIEGDHWHAHAEIPSPLPSGGKLWVEVESEKGDKTVAGFDLKL